MRRPLRTRLARTLLLTLALCVPVTLATAVPASADTNSAPLSQDTGVGVHNTYNNSTFTYLANALDTGLSLIELDVWVDPIFNKWHVSHDNPLGSSNNCTNATSAAGLYSGSRNQDLPACLSDLRYWSDAHPTHGPVVVKVEMKAGFDATASMGPTQFDTMLNNALGSRIYRPADLRGGYSTLDAAALANNWPSRSALSGKFLFEVIPGTFEQANPFDHLWTDVEYGDHVRDAASGGTLSSVAAFPSVLGAASGDPRSRYTDTTIRPWFVFFDGDAATYVSGIDTSWYDTNHYFLIMTDAQNVPPTLSDTAPSQADAQARVAQLAKAHASIVSCDWAALPTVLAEVLPRG